MVNWVMNFYHAFKDSVAILALKNEEKKIIGRSWISTHAA